jgi:hypothetical protein
MNVCLRRNFPYFGAKKIDLSMFINEMIRKNKLEFVKWAMSNIEDLSEKYRYVNNELYNAISLGYNEIASYLVYLCFIDIDRMTRFNILKSGLRASIINLNMQMIELFIGLDVTNMLSPLLWCIPYRDDCRRQLEYILSTPYLSVDDISFALNVAFKKNQPIIVKLLMDYSAKYHANDRFKSP